METITKEFEIEIGTTRYTFDIEFNYYEGTSALDPTESEDAELNWWEFDGPIYAYDEQLDAEWIVTESKEIDKIKSSFDIYSLFEKAIS